MKRFPVLLLVLACARGPVAPGELHAGEEACAHCRMIVSDGRTAAQIAAPGEVARFFDDVGCLRDYLKAHPLGSGARAFVADHRTREWVAAERAVYVRGSAETPMGSHLLAYANAASREADAAALGAAQVATKEVVP